ncbi:hypothetical protein ACOMHN_058546 [Nucella lapillus]
MLQLAAVTGCNQKNTDISQGKEFIFGFLNTKHRLSAVLKVMVSTTSVKRVKVVVSTPRMHLPGRVVYVSRGQPATVTVDRRALGSGIGLSVKAVSVMAREPVTVTGVTSALSLTDTFLVLPVQQLGLVHYLVTSAGQPEFLIVATQDHTVISFHTPVTIRMGSRIVKAGTKLRIRLHKYETFHMHYPDSRADFTGVCIVSSKPVSVVSGNLYTYIGSWSIGHVVETMLPIELWGTRHLTSHTPHMKQGDVFKMVALEDDTTITFGTEVVSLLKAGDSKVRVLPSYIFREITSDKPITVGMFSKASFIDGRHVGGPSLMVMPPVKLCGRVFTWTTPQLTSSASKKGFKHSLSVLIHEGQVEGLVLDGKSGANLTWNERSVIGGSGMVNVWTDTTSSSTSGAVAHILTHANPRVAFQALLSGLGTDQATSYLTPAGFGTVDHRCEISGDPHMRTYGGQKVSLAIPCAYVVTRLRLNNPILFPGDLRHHEIRVEVVGGNSQHTVNGRFYVSACCVRVVMGPHANTYCTSETLINNGTAWTKETADAMQGRVWHKYDAATNMASLGVTHTNFLLQFRPVNRAQGNLQRLRPGIFCSVCSKGLIYDTSAKFPATLCSTVDDRDSIVQDRLRENILPRFMGIFGVLKHLENNLPHGDQDSQCSNLQSKLNDCDQRYQTQAFNECFGMLGRAPVQKCLQETFASVSHVLLHCLDVRCSDGVNGCSEMLDYGEKCPDILRVVDMDVCGYMK